MAIESLFADQEQRVRYEATRRMMSYSRERLILSMYW